MITKEQMKAEQERLKRILREEEKKRKEEQSRLRAQERADKKAWHARRSEARVKVRMEDSKSLPKKNLMKSFLGNDLFE